MFFDKRKTRRNTTRSTLSTETLESRSMFSASAMDLSAVPQSAEGLSLASAITAPLATVETLTGTSDRPTVSGLATAEGVQFGVDENPPVLNEIFDRLSLLNQRIETLVPERDYVSDMYANTDVAQEFFDRGVVYGANGRAAKEAAKLTARGYLAADQGYQDALEHRESQLSMIEGMEDVDLNGDGKTGVNECNNGYDQLENSGWASVIWGKICDWWENEGDESNDEKEDEKKDEKKDESKDDITAESEGRYLLQEVSKRYSNPVDSAQSNVLMAEIVQGSRYDHARIVRYQAFAMMGR